VLAALARSALAGSQGEVRATMGSPETDSVADCRDDASQSDYPPVQQSSQTRLPLALDNYRNSVISLIDRVVSVIACLRQLLPSSPWLGDYPERAATSSLILNRCFGLR
jgi:hypothetical protein